jgi:hypothetical protein
VVRGPLVLVAGIVLPANRSQRDLKEMALTSRVQIGCQWHVGLRKATRGGALTYRLKQSF